MRSSIAALCLALVPFAATAVADDVEAEWAAEEKGWPREFKNAGAGVLIYQPQVESWRHAPSSH